MSSRGARNKRALLAATATVGPGLGAWAAFGFSVDDALITARVAHHLRGGLGYRFNPGEGVTDAVTPLGYAHLLAAVGGDSPIEIWQRGRWLGLVCAALAVAIVAWWCARRPGSVLRLAVPTLFLASLPCCAWATSGMETPLAMLMVAAAVVVRPRYGVWLFGAAAAWRPELLAAACTFAIVRTFSAQAPRSSLLAAFAVLVPAALVAIVRATVFNSPAPLAVLAKPSDLAHGVRYALGAVVLVGWLPLLLVRPARLSQLGRASWSALLAHIAAMMLVGGDWMPAFRLTVPLLPVACILGAELAVDGGRGRWVRALTVGVAAAALWWGLGRRGRAVVEARLELVNTFSVPATATVAALDVGWVGAAHPGRIVDLAGVTDRSIALLPGGHTSKRVPPAFLRERGVDCVVVLTEERRPVRQVEARLLRLMDDSWTVTQAIPLRGTRQSYLVYRLMP